MQASGRSLLSVAVCLHSPLPFGYDRYSMVFSWVDLPIGRLDEKLNSTVQ